MGGAVAQLRYGEHPRRGVVSHCMDAARDFGFWVGTWDCTWDGGSGRNVVDWVCEGRVLQERFDASAHGLVGTSISLYDAAAGRWVQTWMDSEGSWFHLMGAMSGGVMDLLTTELDADGYRKRMRFSEIGAERFLWTWARSRGEDDWEPLWAIRYRRAA
jgi:hypothetical protein